MDCGVLSYWKSENRFSHLKAAARRRKILHNHVLIKIRTFAINGCLLLQ